MFDVMTGRVRIGLVPTDASKDAIIQIALDATIAVVEKWLDRGIVRMQEKTKFYYTGTVRQFQLPRWPVENVIKVEGLNADYKINAEHGYIELGHNACADEFIIEYIGGYNPLPGDLEVGLWMVFDGVFSNMEGSGSSALTGGIGKFSIVGVGTIDYSDNSTSSSAGANGASGLIGEIPAQLFSPYKRYYT